jgi:hypothetical protein
MLDIGILVTAFAALWMRAIMSDGYLGRQRKCGVDDSVPALSIPTCSNTITFITRQDLKVGEIINS